jgi:hypothetical protein
MAPGPHVDGDPFWGLVRSRRTGAPWRALACARPAEFEVPLSRLSNAEIARVAVARDIVGGDQHHACLALAERGRSAAVALSELDLAARSGLRGQGQPNPRPLGRPLGGQRLRASEHVICADEKTSIRARARIHAGMPPAPGLADRSELEHQRQRQTRRRWEGTGGGRRLPTGLRTLGQVSAG